MIFASTPHNISLAAAAIAAGKMIGLPTETVYGLAADANCPDAIAKIYRAKNRPSNHPLIVHLAPQAEVTLWAKDIPNYAYQLMKAFWPGACTVVLPRTQHVGDFITGHQNTVALRCPSHPVAQQLLTVCHQLNIHGIAAPSANQFGCVSPTTAHHVYAEFMHLDDELFILDGGACEIGIESTIIDCTQATPRILRHGLITPADITRITGLAVANDITHSSNKPRVSGSLTAHYAPKTPIRLCSIDIEKVDNLNPRAVLMGRSPTTVLAAHYQAMPNDAIHYAQQLYATLRHLDTMGYDEIIVEAIPNTDEWAGVTDRLTRAAATFLV
jgi:L-threonylcarbamoyladenylate synthase